MIRTTRTRIVSVNSLLRDPKIIDYDYSTGSAVLSTAVIARSSSAPRLQTFKADEGLLVNGESNCSSWSKTSF